MMVKEKFSDISAAKIAVLPPEGAQTLWVGRFYDSRLGGQKQADRHRIDKCANPLRTEIKPELKPGYSSF
jgi:hypothetical protein